MPMILNCPSCGKPSQVANLAPGSAVRCPHCSLVMRVPGEALPVAASIAIQVPAPPPVAPPPVVLAPPPVFRMENDPATDAAPHVFLPPAGFPLVPSLSTLELMIDEPLESAADGDVFPPEYSSNHEAVPDGDDDTVDELQEVSGAISRPSPLAIERSAPALSTLIILGSIGFLVIATLTYFITLRGGLSSPDQAASSANSPAPTATGPDQPLSEWEQENAPRLSEWRSDAKGMQVSGDLGGAQLLYLKMLTVAQSPGTEVGNPGVLAELADAKANFDAITRQIGPPSPAMNEAAIAASDEPVKPVVTPMAVAPPKPAESPTVIATPAPKPAPPPDTQGPGWESAHRDQILALLADADSLEKNKKPAAAIAKVAQLLQLIDDRGAALTDPALKAAFTTADASRKRLFIATRDDNAVRTLTAQAFLAAGLKAEQDGNWKTALETLNDSSKLQGPMLRPVQRYRDPTYLKTLDAMAVAYMNLKQPAKANVLFDDDEPLGRASLAANSPTRELIWNRAANDLGQKTSIMRAIKTVQGYLDSRNDTDEQMLNLLGTVLFVADESNPPDRRVLDDAIGFYSQRSNDLEKTRPGQRRWGIEWLPEADAQRKFDQYNKAIDAYQAVLRQKTIADNHLKDLESAVNGGNPMVRATATDVKNAKTQIAQLNTSLKAAHDAIPRAVWLTDVRPLIPPLVDAPPPSPAGASDSNSMQTPIDAPPAPASQPAADEIQLIAPEARYAAAFPVDPSHLVTAAEPLGSATQVTIEDTQGNIVPARVVAKSDRLALIEIAGPGGLHALDMAIDFTGGAVQCPAIPQANLFGPGVTLLSADAPPPARSAWWIGLSDHPRLPGSPLLDTQNEIIGVELAQRDDDRQRIPAVTLADLRKFLEDQHVVPASSAQKVDPTAIWQVTARSQ